jgi:hypothetical protein
MADSCATCQFFTGGACHQRAPVSGITTDASGTSQIWVPVLSTDWCGLFTPGTYSSATNETCGNCFFYGADGACHYNEPSIINAHLSGVQKPWPAVAATDWCGAWADFYQPPQNAQAALDFVWAYDPGNLTPWVGSGIGKFWFDDPNLANAKTMMFNAQSAGPGNPDVSALLLSQLTMFGYISLVGADGTTATFGIMAPAVGYLVQTAPAGKTTWVRVPVDNISITGSGAMPTGNLCVFDVTINSPAYLMTIVTNAFNAGATSQTVSPLKGVPTNTFIEMIGLIPFNAAAANLNNIWVDCQIGTGIQSFTIHTTSTAVGGEAFFATFNVITPASEGS